MDKTWEMFRQGQIDWFALGLPRLHHDGARSFPLERQWRAAVAAPPRPGPTPAWPVLPPDAGPGDDAGSYVTTGGGGGATANSIGASIERSTCVLAARCRM